MPVCPSSGRWPQSSRAAPYMQASGNSPANAALAAVGSWAAALHLVASMTISRSNPNGPMGAHLSVRNMHRAQGLGLTLHCVFLLIATTVSQAAFASLFSRVNCHVPWLASTCLPNSSCYVWAWRGASANQASGASNCPGTATACQSGRLTKESAVLAAHADIRTPVIR